MRVRFPEAEFQSQSFSSGHTDAATCTRRLLLSWLQAAAASHSSPLPLHSSTRWPVAGVQSSRRARLLLRPWAAASAAGKDAAEAPPPKSPAWLRPLATASSAASSSSSTGASAEARGLRAPALPATFGLLRVLRAVDAAASLSAPASPSLSASLSESASATAARPAEDGALAFPAARPFPLPLADNESVPRRRGNEADAPAPADAA